MVPILFGDEKELFIDGNLSYGMMSYVVRQIFLNLLDTPMV